MAEASNKVNYIMKKFSAVGTIVLPLTLIAGIWGMNVHGMLCVCPAEMLVPGMGEDTYSWFICICVIMLTYTVALMYLFWKRGWF
jgi:magnesium transporter